MHASLITRRHGRAPHRCDATDVLVDGETIVALLAPGVAPLGRPGVTADRSSTPRASTSCPGGIDATRTWSCRSAAPSRPTPSRRARAAAAWGGTTTIVDFAVQRTGERRAGRARPPGTPRPPGDCAIDYGVPHDHRRRRRRLAQGDGRARRTRASPASSSSWPTPASSTATTARSCGPCRRAANNGAMIMMHAENGIAIDVLVQQALARGETDPSTTASPGRRRSRPRPPTGRSCWPTSRAPCPLYVVHMSATRGRRHTWRRPATTGGNVFGETCPQYLYLSPRGAARRPGLRGREVGVLARRCASKHEHHQDDLWNGLRTNDLAGRHHRPLPVLLQGAEGARHRRLLEDPQRHRPAVEHRMDLLYQGVVDGQISARAMGRAVLHHAGADVRPVPAARASSRPAPTPTSSSTTRTAHTTISRRDPPHEHGPLGLGGLRGRRAASTPCSRAARSSSTTARTTGRAGHGQLLQARPVQLPA